MKYKVVGKFRMCICLEERSCFCVEISIISENIYMEGKEFDVRKGKIFKIIIVFWD
jgi:hypothetical protein